MTKERSSWLGKVMNGETSWHSQQRIGVGITGIILVLIGATAELKIDPSYELGQRSVLAPALVLILPEMIRQWYILRKRTKRGI